MIERTCPTCKTVFETTATCLEYWSGECEEVAMKILDGMK